MAEQKGRTKMGEEKARGAARGKAQHTPGPWTAHIYSERRFPHVHFGVESETECAGSGVPQYITINEGGPTSRGTTLEEAAANAKLIAAAPALADALERATAFLAHVVEYAHYNGDEHDQPNAHDTLRSIESEAREVAKAIGYDGDTCTALRAAGVLASTASAPKESPDPPAGPEAQRG